jgi:hypothetical protein
VPSAAPACSFLFRLSGQSRCVYAKGAKCRLNQIIAISARLRELCDSFVSAVVTVDFNPRRGGRLGSGMSRSGC